MPRGRKRIPDAVLAIKGGRRHHRQPEPRPAPGPIATFEIPDWLTSERARGIFRRIVDDYLQRRIIRPPDFIIAARWAHYLDLWIAAKDPESVAGLDRLVLIERALRPLEDRLGLSPLARQEILRGLAAMPAMIGEMLMNEKAESGGTVPPVGEAADVPTAGDLPSSAALSAVSPLGFLKLVKP